MCRHKITFAVAAAGLLLLAGCGGSSVVKTSVITGTVLDLNFQAVRDAKVWTEFGQTTTSSAGSYALTKVGDGEVRVYARVNKGGTWYAGSTSVLTTPDVQSNGNIIVAPEAVMARVQGNVQDRSGYNLAHASVFAYFGGSNSKRVFTDEDGNFEFDDLPANTSMKISASGRTFRSDQAIVNLSVGEVRQLNFILDDAGSPDLTPPQNITATAYTSEPVATRGASSTALDWVKNHVAKQRKGRTVTVSKRGRLRSDVNVEVELNWDVDQFPDLFGYGVYRSTSVTQSPTSWDFVFDPLGATYLDAGLEPLSDYYYSLTTASAWFPDDPYVTESDFSPVVGARTLERVYTSGFNFSTNKFQYTVNSGATSYVVYLFDTFPSVNTTAKWHNESSPSTTGSVTYTGPALQSGRTYYWFVEGRADGGASRTISQIEALQP
ncbi:MAG: carboxypeptidase regulatory-like domain-containing protein [Fimbriimonadaceae bacterium]|nr:carboxypeptidase regulatory-like domain-containing protein [Fimbriimonadaceae bacterium]